MYQKQNFRPCNPRRLSSLLLMASLAAVGCGDGLRPDYASLGLVPISGTVTLDGQPLSGAVVFFEAEDKTQAYATTDENGVYEMKFNSEVNGVTPGKKVVRISTTASTGEEDGAEPEGDPDEEKKAAPKNDRVPAAYNSKSKLVVEVTDAKTVYDFKLNSDGSTTGPS